MQRALEDCAMPKADLDGYVNASSSPNDMTVLMAEYHIHHLPFVDGERPVGRVDVDSVQHAVVTAR